MRTQSVAGSKSGWRRPRRPPDARLAAQKTARRGCDERLIILTNELGVIAAQDQNVTTRLLVVVMLVVSKPVDPIHFQRAVVFMQAGLDLDVMPLLLSYSLGVLDAVALPVFVIFQHIVVAIPPNISRDVRLSDAMRLGLLIILIPMLTFPTLPTSST